MGKVGLDGTPRPAAAHMYSSCFFRAKAVHAPRGLFIAFVYTGVAMMYKSHISFVSLIHCLNLIHLK